MCDVPARTQPGEPGENPAEVATRVFVDHRGLLFSVVYNMLGSAADTEDVLQETWLAWVARIQAAAGEQIASPRAYLVRMAVNEALARQASISRRREDYVGPWLPEPLLTEDRAGDSADTVVRAESVSIALLVVLETLTPLERAVFVLHEVFGYAHTEIADVLDRSPSAVRQLAHRAREHVHARRPRYQTNPRVSQRVTERFLAAVVGGDLSALMQILAPDVTVWADGGGKARAAGTHPVHGRDKAARLIIGDAFRHPIPDLDIRYRRVNGEPAALLLSGSAPYMLVSLDLIPDGDQVRAIYVITNPDKLSHLG
jgi:RNA polymerase sigma-70 factor (ECF subfamily)